MIKKKTKTLSSRLHIRPHCAGSTLSELHFLYFLFHCGKVGLVVVRPVQTAAPSIALILCHSLLLSASPTPNLCSIRISEFISQYFQSVYFFLETRSPVPQVKRLPPSALPSVRMDRETDALFFLSLPFTSQTSLHPSCRMGDNAGVLSCSSENAALN